MIDNFFSPTLITLSFFLFYSDILFTTLLNHVVAMLKYLATVLYFKSTLQLLLPCFELYHCKNKTKEKSIIVVVRGELLIQKFCRKIQETILHLMKLKRQQSYNSHLLVLVLYKILNPQCRHRTGSPLLIMFLAPQSPQRYSTPLMIGTPVVLVAISIVFYLVE